MADKTEETKFERTPDVNRLMHMLMYMRPHGSVAEGLFVQKFIEPLGFVRDQWKNLVLVIPNKDGTKSPIMWSSHVDTVHRRSGLQTVTYDEYTGDISLSRRSKKTSTCLGADCTAGVWLMVEMAENKVPGTYVIHHGEEVGGIGSGDLAKGGSDTFFEGLKFCIAFDRYGFSDVITRQGWSRTASDAFAQSFADIMNADDSGMIYQPDDGGIFTDSANYKNIIAECTNVAVGYNGHHTPRETLNAPFIIHLRNLLISRDFSGLVCERDPNEVERYHSYGRGGGGNRYYGYDGYDDYGYGLDDSARGHRQGSSSGSNDRSGFKGNDLSGLIKQYPGVAHSILTAYGVNKEDFIDEMERYYGVRFG